MRLILSLTVLALAALAMGPGCNPTPIGDDDDARPVPGRDTNIVPGTYQGSLPLQRKLYVNDSLAQSATETVTHFEAFGSSGLPMVNDRSRSLWVGYYCTENWGAQALTLTVTALNPHSNGVTIRYSGTRGILAESQQVPLTGNIEEVYLLKSDGRLSFSRAGRLTGTTGSLNLVEEYSGATDLSQ